MKILYAVVFFALGGVLFFLLKSPEKEEMETDYYPSEKEEIPKREISNQIFYPPLKSETGKKPVPSEKGQVNESKKEIQLNLKEAVSNELFGGLISGNQAIGSLVIFDNQIQSLSISLAPFGKAPINLQLDGVPLESAGSFVFEGSEEIISGILTPSGDKDYILRFATGPLVGATLLFEKISSVEDKVGVEETQISQAHALSDQVETQEMNQTTDTNYSEMNVDTSIIEEMPVNETEINQELEVADYNSDTTTMDMQETPDGQGVNF
jgi:hypothetical protein